MRESVVDWYSFSNPRTRCIHCDNCLVIREVIDQARSKTDIEKQYRHRGVKQTERSQKHHEGSSGHTQGDIMPATDGHRETI